MATKATSPKPAKPKKPCQVSLEDFLKGAKVLTVDIAGVPHAAMPKEFSTGSYGWNINGKQQVEIGGVKVDCQVGLNLTIINSKPQKTEGA